MFFMALNGVEMVATTCVAILYYVTAEMALKWLPRHALVLEDMSWQRFQPNSSFQCERPPLQCQFSIQPDKHNVTV